MCSGRWFKRKVAIQVLQWLQALIIGLRASGKCLQRFTGGTTSESCQQQAKVESRVLSWPGAGNATDLGSSVAVSLQHGSEPFRVLGGSLTGGEFESLIAAV